MTLPMKKIRTPTIDYFWYLKKIEFAEDEMIPIAHITVKRIVKTVIVRITLAIIIALVISLEDGSKPLVY